ncbi:DUF4399 domain-containing protein [Methylobacterium soli]|uniref:DUF4399 domain-containing protein n=1 Tax=Methylobacterium soli TaxID=553447 RepID=A0A6L3T5T9_9HYPH|nr:DUF4399 domain-containing protein [Methylobacterium soli]KAB1081790.1 DUF4399 domain-containing protein [Methylobacterium soli]GJE43530.1 hypothetical protein AEGHOMDF_2709 [Methylobacterium soli]
MRAWTRRTCTQLAIPLVLAAGASHAQDNKTTRTPSAPGAAVYFIDIKDGAVLPRKAMIRFGLRNMGVAPAGSDRINSGHHHLLIDVAAPAPDRPIPNDFNHLHFGAGQTEAEVDLPPGEHTLQLLLADKDHVPHNPPIASEVVKVRVVESPTQSPTVANTSPQTRRSSPPGARVYFVQPRNGSVIARKTTIRFGLVGMGVAPAGFDKANTGHHHLLIDTPMRSPDERIPNDFNHLHFGLGQTEAQVTLPLGTHTLQLVLADADHVPHNPVVMSDPIKVLVTRTGRRSRAKHARAR